jgi:hypothetical protein
LVKQLPAMDENQRVPIPCRDHLRSDDSNFCSPSVPVDAAARSSLATADAASFVVLPRQCASRITATSLSECPVMVAISGTSHPARRVTADPRISWNVRSSGTSAFVQCLAPTRAEAVLRPRRIVRGSEDHGHHALGPVERGLERSADRNLDPPAFAFLALPLAQPDELAV